MLSINSILSSPNKQCAFYEMTALTSLIGIKENRPTLKKI